MSHHFVTTHIVKAEEQATIAMLYPQQAAQDPDNSTTANAHAPTSVFIKTSAVGCRLRHQAPTGLFPLPWH